VIWLGHSLRPQPRRSTDSYLPIAQSGLGSLFRAIYPWRYGRVGPGAQPTKCSCPARMLAQMLARAGLHLGGQPLDGFSRRSLSHHQQLSKPNPRGAWSPRKGRTTFGLSTQAVSCAPRSDQECSENPSRVTHTEKRPKARTEASAFLPPLLGGMTVSETP